MSAEENKAIYLGVVEDLNRGDLKSSLAFTAPDATLNGQPLGREGDRHRAEMLAEAFPDQRYDIQEMIAEGDILVVRWRMTGTHLGELAGPTMTVPATGKRLDIWGMSMYRIEEGMATEIWERFDMMEFLSQLGIMYSPGQSEEAGPA
ncbi:MAG: ester cyclase [Rubrobacter sp.]|nr:ester cyclase [Rubrobacter sp.]